MAAAEFDDAPLFGLAQERELAGSAAQRDDVDTRRQHGVEMAEKRHLVESRAAVAEGRADRHADTR